MKGTRARKICSSKKKRHFWANFSKSQNTSGQVHIPSRVAGTRERWPNLRRSASASRPALPNSWASAYWSFPRKEGCVQIKPVSHQPPLSPPSTDCGRIEKGGENINGSPKRDFHINGICPKRGTQIYIPIKIASTQLHRHD